MSWAVLRYIPHEDKTAGLFKNLRLKIFASPCDISKVVLRYIPNEDKTAELFKNLRLEIFASPCDILWAVLIYIPHEDKTVRLFKNLRFLQVHVVHHRWSLQISLMKTKLFKHLRLKILTRQCETSICFKMLSMKRRMMLLEFETWDFHLPSLLYVWTCQSHAKNLWGR